MVDFGKRRNGKPRDRKTNPREIYDSLDRISEKGPLRPAQEVVLDEWYANRQSERDVIVKLHTGKGKTLVGLLILQSHLNSGRGPVIYVCPNIFLAEQTCETARQFGIKYFEMDDSGVPVDFGASESILITYVQRLFNGLTQFGLDTKSESASAIVIDDAHACIQSIRQAFTMTIPGDKAPYGDLLELFSSDLQEQGVGEFADIQNNVKSAFLPVPYWAWSSKEVDVARLLSKNTGGKHIKFTWPLIKDILKDCLCIVAGDKIQISPYYPPLDCFGTFHSAKQRIFMSATISDDSFLIKALGVASQAVISPIKDENEKWSGEKMILVPALIDDTLDRTTVASILAAPLPGRKKGYVALTPSFEQAKLWAANGATLVTTDTISSAVKSLRSGDCSKAVVFANRYDGMDLPDDACRVLVLDSKPFAEDLIDSYQEACRGNTEVIETRLAQVIEQGMGRHIRGEKDYGVVVISGPTLIKAIRSKRGRRFFSAQTRHQIEIGLEVTGWAKEDLEDDADPKSVFLKLIRQCVDRDEQWKDHYVEQMNKLPDDNEQVKVLQTYIAEREAEELFQNGYVQKAINRVQYYMDKSNPEKSEKGWYLQEMARCRLRDDTGASNDLQVQAHKLNKMLLRPKSGMQIENSSHIPLLGPKLYPIGLENSQATKI